MTQAVTDFATTTSLEAMQDRLYFAHQLQQLTNKIHATDNISQIMVDLSAEISRLFQCERLTLYVHDKERGALVSKVKTGIDASKDLVLPVNRHSIAGYVAATRTTVRINDLDDPEELKRIDPKLEFFSQVDALTGFKSKQMLAAPLVQGAGREMVGVLQLINQRVDGRFDKVAEEGVEALTATLALAFAKRIKASALLPKRYEALVEHGVLAAPELDLAQRWAQRKGKELEQVLVEDFKLGLAKIGKALAKASGLEYQPLAPNWFPNVELLRKLNKTVARQQQWLPHSIDRNMVLLVTSEPDNRENQQPMRLAFPYNEIQIRFTTRSEFDTMMEKCWPAKK